MPLCRLIGAQVSVSSLDVASTHVHLFSQWRATAAIARIKSPFFDIALMIGILAYGVALFAIVKGKDGLHVLSNALRGGSKRK
jgi:hypothetical protein